MTNNIVVSYLDHNYILLRKLILNHYQYTLVAYPGGTKPRLKIMSKTGLTVLYADFDTVIAAIIVMLDADLIDYKLIAGDSDND